MAAPTDAKVLLMSLWERVSAKGNTYMTGFLGKAKVVAFKGDPTADGIPTWNLFLTPGREQSEGTSDKKPRAPAQRTSADHARGAGDYRRPTDMGDDDLNDDIPF